MKASQDSFLQFCTGKQNIRIFWIRGLRISSKFSEKHGNFVNHAGLLNKMLREFFGKIFRIP
jgi:hypothetical protein